MLNFLSMLLFSLAYSYPTNLKVYEGEKYKNVVMTVQDKLHLNEKCKNLLPKKCDALEAASTKSGISVTKGAVTGHPASRYCHDKNGVARILISEDKKEYDYCLFSDGSMVDSWDLYYKHYPRQ